MVDWSKDVSLSDVFGRKKKSADEAADVMPESPVVVTPQLTTIPPTPRPATKERLAGNEANRAESRLNPAREKPARKVFNIPGEMMWVSCTLATCIRSAL